MVMSRVHSLPTFALAILVSTVALASNTSSPYVRLEVGIADIGRPLSITLAGLPQAPYLIGASLFPATRQSRFGTWCLDVNRTVLVRDTIRGPGLPLDETGRLSLTVDIPNRLRLRGLAPIFQAAVVDRRAPGGIALSRSERRPIADGSRGDFRGPGIPLLLDQGLVNRSCPVDVDGDGDVDLVLWGPGVFRLWINDGAGNFTDGTHGGTTGLPTLARSPTLVAALDADGDGDLDLAYTGNASFPPDYRVHLLINDGRGFFTDGSDGPTTGTPPALNCCIAYQLLPTDLDGDGSTDLLARMNGGQLLLNDGHGRFRDATFGPGTGWVTPFPGARVALGDFDGDGDIDEVGVNWSDNGSWYLYLNDGHGLFYDGTNGPVTGLPAAPDPFFDLFTNVAAGDLDGDGDLDLVLTAGHGQARTWMNDGHGFFVDETWQGPDGRPRLPLLTTEAPREILLDVDRDGDLDIIHPDWLTNSNLLFLNDGLGYFSLAAEGSPSHPPDGPMIGSVLAEVFDPDADGDLDVLATSPRLNDSYLDHVEIFLNR
jgi:VCBS repeat protein